MKKTIDVIIVTYNSEPHLRRCLASLAAQDEIDPAIWIQDNGSSDDSVRTAQELCEELSLKLHLEIDMSNPGYSVAVNRQVVRGQAEFVLVLNPDTSVAPVSSGTLLRELADLALGDGIGFVSPLLVTEHGTIDQACARLEPTALRAASTLLDKSLSAGWLRRWGYNLPVVDGGGAVPVDAVNGAFMIVHRPNLYRIGLMDERYWMYGEDLDWCRQARQAGFSNLVDTDRYWMHAKGGSEAGQRGPATSSAFRESMLLYHQKYYPQRRYAPVRVAARAALRLGSDKVVGVSR